MSATPATQVLDMPPGRQFPPEASSRWARRSLLRGRTSLAPLRGDASISAVPGQAFEAKGIKVITGASVQVSSRVMMLGGHV